MNNKDNMVIYINDSMTTDISITSNNLLII